MKLFSKRFIYIPYFAAFFITSLYFLFQFHHIQQFLDFDQIVYCNNILAALKYKTAIMFNSHHLHMEIGGKWFHQCMIEYFEKSGFTDVVFNNRLRSVIFASTGIFFMILYLKEITGKLTWGFIGGILTGFCHGYLSYATKVDTAIYPAAGMILILWIFLKLEKAKKWSVLLSVPGAIILFLSVMFHQYMGIACMISVITLALPSRIFQGFPFRRPFSITNLPVKPEIDRSPKKRYITAAVTGLLGILLVCGGYFYAGETCYNLPFSKEEKRNWRGPFGNRVFQNWVLGYAVDNKWGKGISNFYPGSPFSGYTRAFLATVPVRTILPSKDSRYDYNMKKPFHKFHLTHTLVAYATIVVLFGAILLFPLLLYRYRRSFLLIFFSIILFSLFTTYWESYYYEFWIIPCLLVCVLGILILNLIAEKLALFIKDFAWYILYIPAIIFTFFISSHNIQYHAVPYARNQVLWGYSLTWPKPYYLKLISRDIYKNPEEPYNFIFKE
ncbi:MAG: hypothetical protein JXJ04_01355 [Spirochaetales bacterium]|nr:hypothetical protein [Spirochaetales bacterium]